MAPGLSAILLFAAAAAAPAPQARVSGVLAVESAPPAKLTFGKAQLVRAAADPAVWTITLYLFDGSIPKLDSDTDFKLHEAAIMGNLHGIVLTIDQNSVVIGAEIFHNALGQPGGSLKLKRINDYQVLEYRAPVLQGTISTKQGKQKPAQFQFQ